MAMMFRPALALVAALVTSSVLAEYSFPRPPEDVDLIGKMRTIQAREAETLLDIARHFNLGQEEIVLANPGVDRWLPGQGTDVVLPGRYILPRGPRDGIVLNVAEMRIYHFPPAQGPEAARVVTHPVSVGRMDWATPLGAARIVRKDVAPSWRPPASIRREAEAEGDPLPAMIAPGPDNPLGEFALRLSVPGYLIHGTNKPWGVGMRVTHGCLRMYPEDIERLFHAVDVGTRVELVNQPVKAGWLGDTLYLEVHPPLDEDWQGRDQLMHTAMGVIGAAARDRDVRLSGRRINQAVDQRLGYPVVISLP